MEDRSVSMSSDEQSAPQARHHANSAITHRHAVRSTFCGAVQAMEDRSARMSSDEQSAPQATRNVATRKPTMSIHSKQKRYQATAARLWSANGLTVYGLQSAV
jgi:hypothetical protein